MLFKKKRIWSLETHGSFFQTIWIFHVLMRVFGVLIILKRDWTYTAPGRTSALKR